MRNILPTAIAFRFIAQQEVRLRVMTSQCGMEIYVRIMFVTDRQVVEVVLL